MISNDPKIRAKQIANLRPVSRDPALAREMARMHGFGSGKHRRCNATKRDGSPCRGWAMYGTPKCIKHGARQYSGTPSSPNRHVRQARDWLSENPPPLELTRTPEWRATETIGAQQGLLRKADLVAAWAAAQNGHWKAWRTLTSV